MQSSGKKNKEEDTNMSKSSLRSEERREVESSRITLRPMEVSDVDDLMVWASDDRVSRYCFWDAYTSKDEALDFFDYALTNQDSWYRAVCLDNRAVGSISITPDYESWEDDDESSRAEIGYVLAYEHWGKGITTKAVKMAALVVFDQWPQLERLEAFVDVDNKGSQRVMEKAGFVREGVLRRYMILRGEPRDMVVFSLLSSDKIS